VSRFLCIMFFLFAAACATSPSRVALRAPDYVYQLGQGDKVKVSVFGEDQLTGEYLVNGNGDISFPLLGPIKAAGRSVEELRTDLQGQLGKEYIRDPKVTVDIVNYRSVFILGEVAQPGEFAFSERLTVYALVAKAGGFTYRANQKSAYIRHEDQRGETQYILESATAVRPGDTVRIGQRIF
jgi:protein involved in polysaccharide export with SLBB domain